MSLAVVDLYSGNMRIIDVALKYGYASPTAFNRAFQSVHGLAPSLVKDGGVSLKSFPPISFKITAKNEPLCGLCVTELATVVPKKRKSP